MRNGGFEDPDSVTSDYSIRATGGTASLQSPSTLAIITGPVSGEYYLPLLTVDSPKLEVFQTLGGITAGTSVDCSIFYNYIGDSSGGSSFVISVDVDDQRCGTASTTGSGGWKALGPGTVVVNTDSPRVTVRMMIDNVNGERIPFALDDLVVIPTSERGLPSC